MHYIIMTLPFHFVNCQTLCNEQQINRSTKKSVTLQRFALCIGSVIFLEWLCNLLDSVASNIWLVCFTEFSIVWRVGQHIWKVTVKWIPKHIIDLPMFMMALQEHSALIACIAFIICILVVFLNVWKMYCEGAVLLCEARLPPHWLIEECSVAWCIREIRYIDIDKALV